MQISNQAIMRSQTGRPQLPVSWIMFAVNRSQASIRGVLGTHLAEDDPVVIIETPVSILRTRSIPPLKHRASRIPRTKAGWFYSPLHIPERVSGLSRVIRSLNRLLFQRELDRLIPENTERIACYDSPMQYHLVKKLRERKSIYLAIDDRTLTVKGEPIAGELEAEKRLLAKVDSVICISKYLADTLETRIPHGSGTPIHILLNGYDDELFNPDRYWDVPSILADVSKPVVLIAGRVTERIDWDGISAAVKARPEWTWLFVGPIDPGMAAKIESLCRSTASSSPSTSPRLLYKSPVPLEQMPALISHCSACAVPYRLNPFTMASCPLKGIEYLAMGAPVLSTRIPALLHYGSAMNWVEEGNGESYAGALDSLMREGNNHEAAKARRCAVSGDSHKDRIRQFRKIVFQED